MNTNSGIPARSSSEGKALVTVLGIVVVAGLAVLAWAGLRPGPMDFAGKGVALSDYCRCLQAAVRSVM